jgi:hypothetical protein
MRTFTDIAGFTHVFHEGAAGHPQVVHPQGVIINVFLGGGLGRSLDQDIDSHLLAKVLA